jgi:hypothetical protein
MEKGVFAFLNGREEVTPRHLDIRPVRGKSAESPPGEVTIGPDRTV